MESLADILNSGAYDSHLQRRKKLWETVRQAYREDPAGTERILAVVGEVYQRGRISRFWDFLAAMSGCDRGWGNAMFLDAIRLIQEQKAGSVTSGANSAG